MPALSIRSRLLALTLVLLVIPYVGYRYVQEMEGFLRDGLDEALLGGARALAGALHGRSGLFPRPGSDAESDLHAHALSSAPQLDGYDGEWGALARRARDLHWHTSGVSEAPPRLALGRHGDHLYMLLDVIDASALIAQPGEPLSGDHVVLRVIDAAGQRHHYLIDTSDSGPVQALALQRDRLGQPHTRRELRIHGFERRSESGYSLELRVPLALLGAQLAVSVVDAAERGRAARHAASNAVDGELGVLVLPSSDIARIIAALGSTPGRRVWVVDAQARVLATGGSLERESHEHTPALLSWVLGRPGAARFADPGLVERLDNPEVASALGGSSATRWRATATDLYVVSAAHPVWTADQVVGAVLVEETSQPIQTARSRALAELFVSTLAVFALAGLALALYASSLGRRLRRLLAEVHAATDRHGRVVDTIGSGHGRDEIGALAGGFSDLLGRLARSDHRLEWLAGSVSQGLRTPLAAMHAALDDLESKAAGPALAPEGVERARQGLQGVQSVIERMSALARTAESMRKAEMAPLDLGELLSAALDDHRHTWPDRDLQLERPAGPMPVTGDAALLRQMLDELLASAVDAASAGAPVVVHLGRVRGRYRLRVASRSSRQPFARPGEPSGSGVSAGHERPVPAAPRPDPGLCIVSLIGEGHGGSVRATHDEDSGELRLEVELPEARV